MGLNIAINKIHELTNGEKRVFEALKRAYSNVSHEVYIYVQVIMSGKRPDFIIIDAKRGIAILEVKDWSSDYITEVTRRKVKLLGSYVDNPIMQVDGYKSILKSAIFSRDFDSIDPECISTAIIFSKMNEDSRHNEELSLLFNSSMNYLFERDIANIKLDKIFNNKYELINKDIKMIRVALFPEIEIVSVDVDDDKKIDIKALDFEQEEFAKKLPIGHYMVTGIPGSGKTVILLARAIHLIKENPHWNILILTYNKSLKCKINNKLDKLAENFKKDINNNLINIEKIKVMHFHGLTSLLTKGRRAETENLDTWFKEKVVEIASRNARPMYDAILIDEYQDFYMNWIELCVKLCKECTSEKDNKKYKNIFLAGDRLQSIYNNKDISWKSVGIDMRGRSKLLKTSYRSAKEHMTLALNFLKNDKTLKTEVEKFYKDEFDDANLEALNSGSVEFISGNLELIGDKILELKDKGYKNEDFLILANNKNQCNLIINQCKSSIKYEMRFIKEISENDIDKNIILTTYQSSKGLEAKVVFLINLDEIYTSNDKEEQLKRKVVYVGITRASEKLFIHRGLGKSEKLVTELMSLNNNGNSKF